MKHNVTFVTSYLRIYGEEYDEKKTFEKRLSLFKKVVELGIPICIFTSPEFDSIFREIALEHENVRVLQILDITDLTFFQQAQQVADQLQVDLVLPEKRSHIKDTSNYMLLMHAKLEFMQKAIEANPFGHEVFGWFDFSLPYIFKNVERTLREMQKHAQREYSTSFLTMPGCWTTPFGSECYLQNQICWRFCGGFFLGDKNSVRSFYDVSIGHFASFLAAMDHHIVWEVNYWAWLEANAFLHPIWYPADHNDTIVDIPPTIYARCLLNDAQQIITYSYPTIEHPQGDRFFPSSASYIYDPSRKKHILNTRYVNYFYQDNWDCIFFNTRRQIRTINVCSELNARFEPIDYDVVLNDETNVVVNLNAFSIGLEDVRLYEANGKIMFIASNVHYIPNERNRMVIGEYDDRENMCKHLQIVHMLWETKCEKNWVPLPTLSTIYFIYKFSPYTVGYLEESEGKTYFHMFLQKPYENKLLNRFRGSSSFIHYDDDHWIGVVHYSESTVPPTYYHCLLLIHKETMLPVRFSDPFKFSPRPIEFCLGFTMQRETYLFWISQMDREPQLLFVDKNKIPLHNECN